MSVKFFDKTTFMPSEPNFSLEVNGWLLFGTIIAGVITFAIIVSTRMTPEEIINETPEKARRRVNFLCMGAVTMLITMVGVSIILVVLAPQIFSIFITPPDYSESISKVQQWSEENYNTSLTDEQARDIGFARDGQTLALENGDVVEIDVVEDRYVRLLEDGNTGREYKSEK